MQMPLIALGAALGLLASAPAAPVRVAEPAVARVSSAAGTTDHPASTALAGHEHGARAGLPPLAPDDPDSGAELIGRRAPRWTFDRWIRSEPLSLESLRGKVVLLRFWTENCHFCAATLPGLESLRKRYARDGLVVVCAFHPKPPREVRDARIVATANDLGFSGVLAVDRHWSTLERYWLDGHPDRNWTSVSFLIDRDGIIRWVHGGGEYHRSDDPRHHRCDVQYRELEQALAAALAAPAARSATQ